MKLIPIVLCECGCGEMLKPYRRKISRFVNHHYVRTEEHRTNHSKFMKGRKHTLGYVTSEETKQKLSITSSGNKHALGYRHTEEVKKRMSEERMGNSYALGSKRTEEFKQTVSARHKGKITSEETKQKQRKAAEERIVSEETKRNRSESQKQLWADPIYRESQIRKILASDGNNQQRPNKLETKTSDLLNRLYPKEWAYTGDGTEIIGGKNPDFVNKKRKLIVEVWGDYWHRGQNPKDRIKIFKPFGYYTLIIWEHELKHMPKLIKKIQKFVENQNSKVA